MTAPARRTAQRCIRRRATAVGHRVAVADVPVGSGRRFIVQLRWQVRRLSKKSREDGRLESVRRAVARRRALAGGGNSVGAVPDFRPAMRRCRVSTMRDTTAEPAARNFRGCVPNNRSGRVARPSPRRAGRRVGRIGALLRKSRGRRLSIADRLCRPPAVRVTRSSTAGACHRAERGDRESIGHVIPRFADDSHFPQPVWAAATRRRRALPPTSTPLARDRRARATDAMSDTTLQNPEPALRRVPPPVAERPGPRSPTPTARRAGPSRCRCCRSARCTSAARPVGVARRRRLPPRERATIAEVMREPVAHLHTELARRYAGKPQPAGEREREAADQALALWQALWEQYSACLKPLLEGDTELAGRQGQAPAARPLRRQAAGARARPRAPRRRRRRSGRSCTRTTGWPRCSTARSPRCPTTCMPHAVGMSCYSTYSHALLLGLADPCAMTVRQIELTDRWLGQWARKIFPYAQQRETEGPVDRSSTSTAPRGATARRRRRRATRRRRCASAIRASSRPACADG